MIESIHKCNTCEEAFELSEFLEIHLKGESYSQILSLEHER